MRRMVIFSFYDREGIADKYIYFLLRELSKVSDKIIIVINGELKEEYVGKMKGITPFIRFRENVGFDAGGYKEIWGEMQKKDALAGWDEIILLNNTFYGPFVPFQKIFDEMDNKRLDFWGLSYVGSELFSHIQSYFLVFRKSIIDSNDLCIFFDEYIDERTTQIKDVYAWFETGIFKFLTERNYSFGVYTDIQNRDIYANSFYLLSERKLPILKAKFAADKCFDSINVMASLRWIDRNSDYDIGMIFEHMNRIYGLTYSQESIWDSNCDIQSIKKKFIEDKVVVKKEALQSFIKGQEKLCIYGAGVYARRIYVSYLKENRKFMGFLISDDEEDQGGELYGYPVYRLSEIKGIGIIVALNKKNTEQVKGKLYGNSFFCLY